MIQQKGCYFSTFPSETSYHEVADEELQHIYDAISEFEDENEIEVNMAVSSMIYEIW
jgi:frataxin-like iron-binding protein CyaY